MKSEKGKHPAGPPMDLGNMRQLGVQNLIASCLNDACRHTALIDVFSYPAETEIPYFRSHVVCAKCGARGNKIDVRPNWKEQSAGREPDRQDALRAVQNGQQNCPENLERPNISVDIAAEPPKKKLSSSL
jgi:hypothetical protein